MATSRLRLTPGTAYLYDGTEGVYQVITGQASELVLDSKTVVSGNLLLTGSAFFKDRLVAPVPGSSEAVLYSRAGTLYFKNSGGAETALGGGGGVSDGDKGDVVVSSGGATWTIDSSAVTNAKMANMAQGRIKGRAVAAGTGSPTDLTAAEVTAIIAGGSGGGTTNFLRADGTWAAPPGGGGGSPAGDSTSVQFNDAGSFGGSDGLTYNKITKSLAIAGDISVDGSSRFGNGSSDTTVVTGSFRSAQITGSIHTTNGTTAFISTVGPKSSVNYVQSTGQWVLTGFGDVVGPGSTTDKAIARFVGTGGVSIDDSVVTISDEASGAVTIQSSTATVNLFNTSATVKVGDASGKTEIQGNLKYGYELYTRGVLTLDNSTSASTDLNGYRYIRFKIPFSGTFTCDLPSPSTAPGRVITIYNDSTSATVDATSPVSTSILGNGNDDNTYSIAAGKWIEICSSVVDGITKWVIVAAG